MNARISARTCAALIGATLSLVLGNARANDEPIYFTEAGVVTLTLTGNEGGYDHILELVGSALPGAVTSPLFVAADSSDLEATGASAASYLSSVGYAGSTLLNPFGLSINLGSFEAGQELIFRLTNVLSPRIGSCDETGACSPSAGGSLVSQIFSGVGSSAPNPLYTDGSGSEPYIGYTSITGLGTSFITVAFEDAFPGRSSFGNLGFTLSLAPVTAPVPEPETYALMLAGLGAIGFVVRRRRPA